VKRTSVGHFNCTIARGLDIVGEWWTPLVLRSLFLGRRRFEEIQGDLGIARNILSDRLSTLVEHGVVEKVKYHDHPVRYEYHLTEMGRDLFGVLMAFMAWGDRWLAEGEPPVQLIHDHCGPSGEPRRTRARVVCAECGADLQPGEYSVSPGGGASTEHAHTHACE
jgi:DNA-binding HxlR family transcriptional regulator